MKSNDDHNNNAEIRFIRSLCRNLEDSEIAAAEGRFRDYLRLAWGIFERIEKAQETNPHSRIRQDARK